MIAVLRLMMPDINIAATTALETLHHQGRELGIKAGANVVMPQMTPQQYREGYLLYKDKPVVFEQLPEFMQNITNLGYNPVIDKWGDSRRFVNKQSVRIRQQPSN
jgi:biotin synthase